MSDNVTSRNSKFLAAAKEVLSKRRYYSLSDAFKAGDVDQIQAVLENAMLTPDVLAQLNALFADETSQGAEEAHEAPVEVVAHESAVVEESPTVEVIKVPKPKKEPAPKVEKAPVVQWFQDPSCPRAALLAHMDGTTDVFTLGAQKSMWIDLMTPAGRIKKEALALAAVHDGTTLTTIFKLGKRAMTGIDFNGTSLSFGDAPADAASKGHDFRKGLEDVSLHLLESGDWLIVWPVAQGKFEKVFKPKK